MKNLISSWIFNKTKKTLKRGAKMEIIEKPVDEFFEEIKENASENGRRLISIIDEYERLLGLTYISNPLVTMTENMITRTALSTKYFINKFGGSEYNNPEMVKLINSLTLLALRLSNLILDLIGNDEVILLPSKRNYLYIGKPVLLKIFEDLTLYKKLADPTTINTALGHLRESASHTDADCQFILEFRLLNILIMFLTIFPNDKQTISFISLLMSTQEKISMGNN